MNLSDVADALIALVAGGALGALYFGGLWWTSRRVATARSPALLFFGSFVVRMACLIGGLYWVTGGRLLETTLALVGVLLARQIAITRVRGGE